MPSWTWKWPTTDGTQGRPKMLLKPHWFWKNLDRGSKRDQAVAVGYAYNTWGEQPYPNDSYPRLIEAMKIDETAALKSASWGLGHIFGENFAMIGYASVREMVLALLDDAEVHLDAMISFILAANLGDKLRAHDGRRSRAATMSRNMPRTPMTRS